MPDADLLLDRARLRRRLTVWRLVAVAAVLVALFAAVRPGFNRPHVARLRIEGVIGDDPDLAAEVARLARDGSVRALVVAIDSPGGAVTGGQALTHAIAEVAGKKPVVAVMGGVAASAGYMVALPAARIFAEPSTLTGSIGVILEAPNIGGLLGKIGAEDTEIVSGPLKNQPSLTAPLSPQGRAYLQGVVDDLFGQFVDLVAADRHLPKDRVRALADGRAYTGHQALALGLIDQYGTEETARAWLAANRAVPETLPTEDVTTDPDRGFIVRRASLAGVLRAALDALLPQRVTLDGAVSIWQP